MHVAKQNAEKLVDTHWKKIETLAQKLIEQEIVESDELASIIGDEELSHQLPDSL